DCPWHCAYLAKTGAAARSTVQDSRVLWLRTGGGGRGSSGHDYATSRNVDGDQHSQLSSSFCFHRLPARGFLGGRPVARQKRRPMVMIHGRQISLATFVPKPGAARMPVFFTIGQECLTSPLRSSVRFLPSARQQP